MPTIAAPSHFTQLRDWSERKHQILSEYLPAFCRALSRHTPGSPIWYVDGYAGAGIYRDPSNPADVGVCGSPVLAAQKTQQLPYSIQCLNIEEDNDNFESLERETRKFRHVRNIHSDFNIALDEVLATVAKCPTFFFLDSFGTKELPMEGLVDRIAMRTKPTDILLRYATGGVRRLAANFEKDPLRGDANARNLDRWFKGQGWRSLIEQHTGNARDDALIHYYLQQIVTISKGQLKFACSYPIRSIEGKTKYHLVFATGDRLGMKLMSDILFKAEARYEEDHANHREQKELASRGGQLSMFDEPTPDPNIEVADRIAKLQASILERCQKGKTRWEYEDLFCSLIENGWFAQILEKHFRAACKKLHTEGKIVRISGGKAWSRDTEFIIRL